MSDDRDRMSGKTKRILVLSCCGQKRLFNNVPIMHRIKHRHHNITYYVLRHNAKHIE